MRAILDRFSPLVQMASIDEAYLDMTGTERLHGPPLKAAHLLHEAVRADTGLNCSIGIATSRLVAKVSSDQAKPNGVLWIYPGVEARFLAPLDIRKIPGVGKVSERRLHEVGIRKVGDLAALDEATLEKRFGKSGLALAGKSRGLDAGGWFDEAIGASSDPKSISHEHTFSIDTAEEALLQSTISKLAEMVSRRLREHGLQARTVQIKVRNQAFETFIRAHTLSAATDLDIEIAREARALFHQNWRSGTKIRLLGVHVSQFSKTGGQLDLLDGDKRARWTDAMRTADRLRDRFGDDAVTLAGGMRGKFRERTHEAMVDKTPNTKTP